MDIQKLPRIAGYYFGKTRKFLYKIKGLIFKSGTYDVTAVGDANHPFLITRRNNTQEKRG